tara:strand:+ start:249 stop:386 length:138 start_codon:yes stop_codon:yes gene_type:complete
VAVAVLRKMLRLLFLHLWWAEESEKEEEEEEAAAELMSTEMIDFR